MLWYWLFSLLLEIFPNFFACYAFFLLPFYLQFMRHVSMNELMVSMYHVIWATATGNAEVYKR